MAHGLQQAMKRTALSFASTAIRQSGSSRYMATAATSGRPSMVSGRSAYSRVKPASSTTSSTTRRVAPVRTRVDSPASTTESSAPPPSASDLAALAAMEEENFPMPQPAAELPDYAKLAPSVQADSGEVPPARYQSTARSSNVALGGIPGEEPVGEFNDWSNSFHGLSVKPFDREIAERLMRPLDPKDVEIKPDGLLYLPEIKYRRTLNEAFGPGGWGLAPRGETTVGPRIVSREWGLVCLGRLVSVARGEQEYFDPSGVPTATEACKSNALMRCCKDLGIASELWDPSYIKQFKAEHCVEAFVEHVVQKKKRKLWRKKHAKFDYPYKEV